MSMETTVVVINAIIVKEGANAFNKTIIKNLIELTCDFVDRYFLTFLRNVTNV